MGKVKHNPPKWADKFLEFYCKEEILEDLQGDLYEYFEDNVRNKGVTRAQLIYLLDVLKFIRPYTISQPQIFKRMNQLMIFRNYFKTSIRNITNNWTFSLINIIGLAISISVGLLMLTLIYEMNSYDKFHSKGDRIYRVINTYSNVEQPDPGIYASTSILTGRKIKENVPGIEKVVILRRHFNSLATAGTDKIPVRGLWASEDFFNLFDFQLLRGNASTCLTDLHSIVITESTAHKIFGNEDDLLGKTINMGDEWGDFKITGIVKDPPKNSHIQFEILGSFSTIDELNKDKSNWMSWSYMWTNYVYFLKDENANIEDIQTAFDKISNEENANSDFATVTISTQELNEIALGKELSNQIGKTMDGTMLVMIAALTFVVLLSACFNYSNLSIARSLRRSKEVGVRKVVGASKGQVFFQFIFESILISLFSLAFSYVMFLWLRPNFLSLDPYLNRLVELKVNPEIILLFILLAIITGVFAGFFPSLFFSRLNPNKVLKSNTSIQLFKGLAVRRLLIIIQFALSIAFILGATLMNKQYRYSLSFDLGYSTENILNLRTLGNDSDVLINEISQLPEVENISTSLIVTSIGETWGDRIKYIDTMDSVIFHYNGIDDKYLNMHNHELIAGSNFSKSYLSGDSVPYQIIVTPSLLEYFNISSPDSVIGQAFEISGRKAEVIGVVNDFQYNTIQNDRRPFLFRNIQAEDVEFLNIKINSKDLFATRDKIEAIWKKVDDVQPMDAEFYKDDIENIYSEYEVIVKIIGYLAFLAITIAILGLLGMVIFTTETRLKEISIRKVLGATDSNLIVLMGRGFMILIVASAAIAIPFTYLLFDSVVFAEYANRASIGVLDILGGTIIIFMIATLTIAVHTFKAARTNPATTLRNE